MATYASYYNQERRTESEEYVYDFLNQIGLGQYFDRFRGKGYNSESDIPYLTSDDLEHAMMISSDTDRQLILQNARHYRLKRVKDVYEWLLVNNLDHYYINFEQNELVDLQKIAQLQLPDESTYFDLEITMPGHKKRLERAVAKLKQNLIPEKPITFGKWRKPSCLPQAKFDFLCVKALIFSHKKPADQVCIDFMVDSGSDVSTIQEEILMSLDLELLGPIYSCGIHGGNHTNLYKARLKIGDEEMDIEIMGSNYDSLGSRVVRHFRHVIDGQHHIWLKGNYKDQPQAVIPLPAPNTLPAILPTTAVPSVSSSTILPTSASITAGPSNLGTSTEISNFDQIKRTTGKRKITPLTSDLHLQPKQKIANVSNPASFNNGEGSNLSKSKFATSSKAFSQQNNKDQKWISSAHTSKEKSSLTDPKESFVSTEQPAHSLTLVHQQTNELEKCTSSMSGISIAQLTSQDSNINLLFSDEGINSVQQSSRMGQSSATTNHSSTTIGQSSASTGQSSASTGQSSASTGQSSVSTGQSARAGSPQISNDVVVESEERISFRNLVPNTSQDTNDDIDHMMPVDKNEEWVIWVDNRSNSNISSGETEQGENLEVVHVLPAEHLNGSLEKNGEEIDIDSEAHQSQGPNIAAERKQGDFVRANNNIMLLSIDELEM